MSTSIESEPTLAIEGLIPSPGLRTLTELQPSLRPGPAGAGVAVGDLLDGADASASHVTVVAHGDGYRASIPIDQLVGHGWLLVDDPDGPAGAFRLVVEDGDTLCWNVKRVATLRVTDHAESDDVPANPTH